MKRNRSINWWFEPRSEALAVRGFETDALDSTQHEEDESLGACTMANEGHFNGEGDMVTLRSFATVKGTVRNCILFAVFNLVFAFFVYSPLFKRPWTQVLTKDDRGSAAIRLEDTSILREDLYDGFVDRALSLTRSGASATCRPRLSIMFLKTHKCASSTLQNVINRRIRKHNTAAFPLLASRAEAVVRQAVVKNSSGGGDGGGGGGGGLGVSPIFVAVPPEGVYFKRNYLDNSSLVPSRGYFDVFVAHTRLDATRMREIVNPDAVWVTIVRHPRSLFQSLFSYYKLYHFYRKPLKTLLQLPLERLKKLHRFADKLGSNQMTYDLGYDGNTFYDDAQIDLMIGEVESNFDLVLVAERMDESLVILGQALCWSTHDLVAFEKNKRMTDNVQLSEEELNTLDELNYSDLRLYHHFTHKFELLTKAFGKERLQEKVEELRAARKELVEECVEEVVAGHSKKSSIREYSGDVYGFRIADPKNMTCESLAWNSIQFFKFFGAFQEQFTRTNIS